MKVFGPEPWGNWTDKTFVPIPVGGLCHYCEGEILHNDFGVVMPHLGPTVDYEEPWHRECLLKTIFGKPENDPSRKPRDRQANGEVMKTMKKQIGVQTRRGLNRAEDKIPVNHIQIPDLWHAFETLRGIAGAIRRENDGDNIVINDRAKALEHVADRAQVTWDLAGDMKRCLQSTIAPAVTETLEILEALKAESEVRRLESSDLQLAIKALTKAFEDGRA